jgi:oligopeptide transport system substrate-binding protein
MRSVLKSLKALPGVLALAGVLCFAQLAQAATIPRGVQLDPRQELIRNNGAEPETLDPMLASGVPANNVIREMFEALTASDNAGKIVPGVAESWRQTDPQTWVFKLRRNAKWSNGDNVTAEDFVYGMRRLVTPATGSKYAPTYGAFLLNGKDIIAGKMQPNELGVKATDPYTIEIKTPFPVSFLPEVLSNNQLGAVHKATLEKHGKDWTKPGNIVTNGAYHMKDWAVNSKIVLTKSPTYWDNQNVQITQVTYLAVESQAADVKLFESGENDWVNDLPPGSFETYKKQYPKEIRNSTMLGLRYYSLNVNHPLFKDVRVRKALNMVIDRDLLAQRITADGQVPAYSVMVAGVNGADPSTYDWASWPMERRVAEAKKLMAEAGMQPGTKIKFAYNTSEYHKKMGIFAASEWKTKLGLELEMEAMEFKVLIKKRDDRDYEMARNGWIADYNDATTFLTLVECDSDQNSQGFCNRKAQDLINQGNKASDPARRKALLNQATKMIMDEYPIVPLLQYTRPRLVKAYVGGVMDTNSLDRYRSKDLYIIKR